MRCVALTRHAPASGRVHGAAAACSKDTLCKHNLCVRWEADAQRVPQSPARDTIQGFRYPTMAVCGGTCRLKSRKISTTSMCTSTRSAGAHGTITTEIADHSDDRIILEGFKAFHDQRVVDLLDMCLFIRVPYAQARKHRLSRNSAWTVKHWDEEIWANHVIHEIGLRRCLQGDPRFKTIPSDCSIHNDLRLRLRMNPACPTREREIILAEDEKNLVGFLALQIFPVG